MANSEHFAVLKQGGKAWNDWRERYPKIKPDFIGQCLEGHHLSYGNLTKVNLSEAQLHGADLWRIDLTSADLTRADLTGAIFNDVLLQDAILTHANLADATISGGTLVGANLSGANLQDVDFRGARIGGTIFAATDLGIANGLETAYHVGPSTIGIDTLYKSKGKIPEVFLRGCGLPDEMIEFARRIAGNPIEFNSCFISYSSEDEEFAKRLYNDLQGSGVRCWFAPHDMKGGKKLREQIDWAIHYHDRTLLILSANSINSQWVKTEIAKARKREVEEKRQVLFPIRLVDFKALLQWEYFDDDTGIDYAKEIREYFIPDFSSWKGRGSYQAAFNKLLENLRAERTKAKSV